MTNQLFEKNQMNAIIDIYKLSVKAFLLLGFILLILNYYNINYYIITLTYIILIGLVLNSYIFTGYIFQFLKSSPDLLEFIDEDDFTIYNIYSRKRR